MQNLRTGTARELLECLDHNCQPDETYVKIGVGRDYADVAPVSGTHKGKPDRTLLVEVKIEKRD